MTTQRFIGFFALLAVFVVGCGGAAPRTSEMLSFEEARSNSYAHAAEARYPDLAKESDAEYKKATAAHEEGEAELALHHTRLASMLWLTAVTKSQTTDAENAAASAEKTSSAHATELAELQAERDRLVTSVTRLRRIAELEGKVAATENQAGAKAKLDAALVAVKEAEALDAERHAAEALGRAKKALADANARFGEQDFSGAARLSDLAVQAAAQAKAVAAPLHAADERKRVTRDEDDALFGECKRVAGGSVSITPRGITLVVGDLFKKRETAPMPEALAVVDQVAAMAKRFTSRNVIVEAHTDSTGGKSQNLTLSQARADAVLTALTERGVSPGRLTAIGKGAQEPIADNRTKDGKAQNRRVVFVFVRGE